MKENNKRSNKRNNKNKRQTIQLPQNINPDEEVICVLFLYPSGFDILVPEGKKLCERCLGEQLGVISEEILESAAPCEEEEKDDGEGGDITLTGE